MPDLLEKDLNYKVKIKVPNIIEIISETFDDVLNHMLPEMLVFGGALRDIVAGFGLHHDLDIAASPLKGEEFIYYLEKSSKWIEECVIAQYKRQAKIAKNETLGVISPHSMGNGVLDLNGNFSYNTRSKLHNYGNSLNARTFINSSGKKLQIIMGKSDPFTLKERQAITIAKTVDFVCCGLVMDINGNVYEIIEGAENDCLKRVLRINKNADIKYHVLNKRIEKFTARGWKSQINLAKIKIKQARLKKTAQRKIIENLKNSLSRTHKPVSYMRKHKLPSGALQIIVNTSKMQFFKYCRNSSRETLKIFYSIFEKRCLSGKIGDCQVKCFYSKYDHVIISFAHKSSYIMSELEDVLRYTEHSFLQSQKHMDKLSDTGKKFSYGQIAEYKYTDQPLSKQSMYNFTYDTSSPTISINTADASTAAFDFSLAPTALPTRKIKAMSLEELGKALGERGSMSSIELGKTSEEIRDQGEIATKQEDPVSVDKCVYASIEPQKEKMPKKKAFITKELAAKAINHFSKHSGIVWEDQNDHVYKTEI